MWCVCVPLLLLYMYNVMWLSCAVSPPLLVKEQGSALPNKPFHLSLTQTKKKLSSGSNNPDSPTCNVTITPADDSPKKLCFDSGNNSMTNSDASGHSAQSELYSGSPMINLDSPIVPVSKDIFQLAEFDPLIRQSISHDSLLFDPYHPLSSRDSNSVSSTHLLPASPAATTTPSQNIVQRQQSQQSVVSTSPRSNQSSPRESLSTILLPTSTVRPRPRGRSDPNDPQNTSAPSSRSQSPKTSRGCPNSPTGSIKSQQYYSTWDEDVRPSYRFDSTSDFGDLVDLDLPLNFNLDDEAGPNLLLDFKLIDLHN